VVELDRSRFFADSFGDDGYLRVVEEELAKMCNVFGVRLDQSGADVIIDPAEDVGGFRREDADFADVTGKKAFPRTLEVEAVVQLILQQIKQIEQIIRKA